MKVLPADPEQRAVALSALEACFAYMVDVKARYGEEPDWGLPAGFFEGYWFLLQIGLKRSMPTLADVTGRLTYDSGHPDSQFIPE